MKKLKSYKKASLRRLSNDSDGNNSAISYNSYTFHQHLHPPPKFNEFYRNSKGMNDDNDDDDTMIMDCPEIPVGPQIEDLEMPSFSKKKKNKCCCCCFCCCCCMERMQNWVKGSIWKRLFVFMIMLMIAAGIFIGVAIAVRGENREMNPKVGSEITEIPTIISDYAPSISPSVISKNNETLAVSTAVVSTSPVDAENDGGGYDKTSNEMEHITAADPPPLPSITSALPSQSPVVLVTKPATPAAQNTIITTPSPTLPPRDRTDTLLTLLLKSSLESTGTVSSIQYGAAMWIIETDPLQLDPFVNDTNVILERYVLVLMYMSMGGGGDEDGKKEGTSWVKSDGFVSGKDSCDWMGVECATTDEDESGDGRIVKIVLENNGLSSSIPTEIGYLTSLTHFSLRQNQITGTIPSEMGLLQNLVYLDLSNNQLDNEIPESLYTNCPYVQYLDLATNNIVGEISSNIGQMVNLKSLDFSNNVLVGNIPTEIQNLIELESLSLHENYLSGPIPLEMYKLTSLRSIRLFKNSLTGVIDNSIKNLVNLNQLLIQNNNLSGEVPSDVGELEELQFMYINHNEFRGTIPSSIGNLVHLRAFYLHKNFIQGNVSSSICELRSKSLQNIWADCMEPSPIINCECCTQCFR